MNLKFTLILMVCAFGSALRSQTPSFALNSQNSFGEHLYPHPGAVLTSGAVTRNAPGFLLAGHVPGQPTGFFVDRLGAGGTLNANNPAIFQRHYTILTGPNCQSTGNQPAACNGVTAIETFVPANAQNGTPALEYAVAGATDNGCFLSFLNSVGVPVNTYYINFSLVQNVPSISSVSRPLLAETSTNSGIKEYFLCGTYDFVVPLINLPVSVFYAHRLNAQGLILWSREYLCVSGGYMKVNDMLESPYTQNLVLVGNTANAALTVELDVTTGGSLFAVANLYSLRNYPCAFQSIALSDLQSGTGAGYVIGGENRNTMGSGGLWFVKMTAAGNITWNSTVRPGADRRATGVLDIIERRNWNNNYEYYGVTTSTAGALVVKLNQMGVPLPQQSNEFIYNAGSPGNASTGRRISFSDLTGVDEGLHVFGNNTATNPGAHYLVQAYFSGHAGCNAPQRVESYERPEVMREEIALLDLNLPLSHCAGISLQSSLVPGHSTLCGPVPFILPPATNARTALNSGIQQAPEFNSGWQVFPNPFKSKTTLTFDNASGSHLEVLNSLGQRVYTTPVAAGQQQVELDFDQLGLEAGVYFLSATSGGEALQEKIVYLGK